MNKIKLNLLDNALSFAEEALEKALIAENQPIQWKFAILNLVQAIELSIKELLRREDWTLIYKNIDGKYEQTVNIQEAQSRLKRISRYELSDNDKSSLEFAQKKRNQIIHHEFELHPNEVKAAFARLFAFLVEFNREKLNSSIEVHVKNLAWRNGLAVKDYAEELFKRAINKIEKDDDIDDSDVLKCTACGYETFVRVEHEEGKCYLCGHEDTLNLCKGCQKPFLPEYTDDESCGDDYCSFYCMNYYDNDYWYEQAVGK